MSARRTLAAAALAAGLAAPAAAWAQPMITQVPPARPPDVVAEAVPAIAAGAAVPWGWNQIQVRIQNKGGRAAKGTVEVSTQQYSSDRVFQASAPYSVGAGASILVRVPARVASYGDVRVQVIDEVDGQILNQSFTANGQIAVVLLDVSPTSRLRSVIHEAPASPLYVPPAAGSMPSSGASLLVSQPRFDPATGDALLPDRPALYAAADAVLMRTDTLVRLAGADLDALAGFVLGGGTLALVPARPEDLRHPTLVSLVGGEVAPGPVAAETRREMLPSPGSSSGRVIPPAPAPMDDVAVAMGGWTGGNLRPSPYGSAATYGLGEVHLLAFDPANKPAVDDPWVQIRMIDLARRAYDRRSTVVFRPGVEQRRDEINRVRQQLDPNESSRWAIGLSALLLCIYAVLAGPLNFTLAARKHRPLRALWHLPVYAAVAFGVIVGIGVAAKGVTGRARHLTLVEAGAGMTKGTARRYRGFYASRSEDITVRTTDASSVVSMAVAAELSTQRDKLVVDRDGARLTDVTALPWQTVVVREDGFASLGEGITVLCERATAAAPIGGATIINRSARDLRAAVLWLPAGGARYFARIKDGEKVHSSAGADLGTTSSGRSWISMAGTGRRVGGLDIHDLGAGLLSSIVDKDAPGLGDAWWAMEEAANEGVDWLPDGVPTLLGQLDGGEGRSADAGLRLESDRLLVRVVGCGGRP